MAARDVGDRFHMGVGQLLRPAPRYSAGEANMPGDRGGGPGGCGNSDSGGEGDSESSFRGNGAALVSKRGKWNKADSADVVPSLARQWNNRSMEAKVQRIVRRAGPAIRSSNVAGRWRCVYHLRQGSASSVRSQMQGLLKCASKAGPRTKTNSRATLLVLVGHKYWSTSKGIKWSSSPST